MEENVIVIKADVKRKRVTIGEQTLIKNKSLERTLICLLTKNGQHTPKNYIKGKCRACGRADTITVIKYHRKNQCQNINRE